MKIRQGFVSNSSSSSFIAVGYKNKVYVEDFYEQEFNNSDIRNIDSDCDDYAHITGIVIADNEELDHTSTSIGKIIEYSHIVADELGVDVEEIELITGTRYC